MAIDRRPMIGTTAGPITPGTALAPTIALPDNCHTVIVYNEDATNKIYIGFIDSGATAIPAAEAVVVPPSSSTTLVLGPRSSRPALNGDRFRFDASGGTPTAFISYINGTQA